MIHSIILSLRVILAILFWLALLFIPAGTFYWPEAWAFIVILAGYTFILFAFVLKKGAKVLKSRGRVKPKYGLDLFLSLILTILFILFFVIPPLDVFRLHWTDHYVSPCLKYVGVSLFTLSLVLFTKVMKSNPFLSRAVEIQEDQTVVTTGPYAVVRHPMYAGNILMFIGLPLMLGSIFALIPAVIMIIIFAFRAVFEERLLEKDLAGYIDYEKKVRFRLIPGVW